MDKLICKHCGNVVYKSEDNVISDVEFHDDKPYDVIHIECPKCGLYNEFEESSETIEKQLKHLEIYSNSIRSWIKSEDATEPSRVESSDSKCQASEFEFHSKIIDALSEFVPRELLEPQEILSRSYFDKISKKTDKKPEVKVNIHEVPDMILFNEVSKDSEEDQIASKIFSDLINSASNSDEDIVQKVEGR